MGSGRRWSVREKILYWAGRDRAQLRPDAYEVAAGPPVSRCDDEVVEDYGHVGLTLRSHPVSFLREDLAARRIVTCAEAMAARDGRWLDAWSVDRLGRSASKS